MSNSSYVSLNNDKIKTYNIFETNIIIPNDYLNLNKLSSDKLLKNNTTIKKFQYNYKNNNCYRNNKKYLKAKNDEIYKYMK